MNEQELISHIEELGLSNKEAKVYVASLKTGPAAVQRIADQAGIKRVTTYVILESLVGLGLMSQSMKGKKTYFIAEEPANLRRLLDKRAAELKEQQSNFENVLPELLHLKTIPKESPDVKFYDSADGIRSLFTSYYDAYGSDVDMVYGMSNLDQLHEFFPEIKEAGTNPERVRRNVVSRYLYTSERGPIYIDEPGTSRESRYIPSTVYPINGDMSIIGDHIIMVSFSSDRPIAVTIHSRDLAATMRAMFDMCWNLAATLPENKK